MILSLIKNQIKEFLRSSFKKQSIAANVFILILYGLIAINFLVAGLAIDKVLTAVAPDKNPVDLFNGFILFYFLSDLLIRFFIQKVHGFNIIPYLHLPIKRNLIKNYLLLKPFWSLFNLTPFLIVLPFAFRILAEDYEGLTVFSWLVFLFFFIQLINYLNLLINRLALIRPLVSLIYVGILALLLSAGIFEVLGITEFSATFFSLPLQNELTVFMPLAGALVLYGLNYNLLQKRFYLDDLKIKSKSVLTKFSNIDFSKNFGELGNYISLEIKLLLRNKRPASTLLFGLPVLLYGFIAYGTEAYKNSYFMNIYWGVFLVSLFMIFYGQFLFGWESSYFDAVLGKNIDLKKYIKAKFYLLSGLCSISFLLTLPYGFFDPNIMFINLNVYLFSIGVSSYLMLFLGTYSRKRIDIQAGLMSMQGKGAMQFLFILPVLLIPILISWPVKVFYNEFWACISLGFLGVTGLVLNKYIMNFLYGQFISQKYKLAEAFREAE